MLQRYFSRFWCVYEQFGEPERLVQLVLILFVLIASILAQTRLRPYSERYCNKLETLELSLLIIILVVGSWFFTVDSD